MVDGQPGSRYIMDCNFDDFNAYLTEQNVAFPATELNVDLPSFDHITQMNMDQIN